MGIRDISERVTGELQNGHSRREVYNNLASASPSDAAKIAYCLASVPDGDLRKKYIKLNATLCILLVVYSLLTLMSALPLETGEPTLFLAISTLTPLVFCYFVFKFHGGVYRLAGIWFVIDLLETFLLTGAPNNYAAFKIITLFIVVVLTFWIGRKVFPNLGILGPKKTDTGEYML